MSKARTVFFKQPNLFAEQFKLTIADFLTSLPDSLTSDEKKQISREVEHAVSDPKCQTLMRHPAFYVPFNHFAHSKTKTEAEFFTTLRKMLATLLPIGATMHFFKGAAADNGTDCVVNVGVPSGAAGLCNGAAYCIDLYLTQQGIAWQLGDTQAKQVVIDISSGMGTSTQALIANQINVCMNSTYVGNLLCQAWQLGNMSQQSMSVVVNGNALQNSQPVLTANNISAAGAQFLNDNYPSASKVCTNQTAFANSTGVYYGVGFGLFFLLISAAAGVYFYCHVKHAKQAEAKNEMGTKT